MNVKRPWLKRIAGNTEPTGAGGGRLALNPLELLAQVIHLALQLLVLALLLCELLFQLLEELTARLSTKVGLCGVVALSRSWSVSVLVTKGMSLTGIERCAHGPQTGLAPSHLCFWLRQVLQACLT